MRHFHTGLCAMAITALPAGGVLASMHNDNDGPQTQNLFADLGTLNERQGSQVSGWADVTVREWSDRAEIRWQIQASGLEPGRAHLQHAHGRFAEDPRPANDPSATDGPFFSGEGGTPINSRVPEFPRDDFNNDGYITFIEGLPAYGPVIQNLTLAQPPHPADGVSPVESANMLLAEAAGVAVEDLTADLIEQTARQFFPTADPDGVIDYDVTFEYDLTNQDARRQFNNLDPLAGNRVIVLHGMTIDLDEVDLRDFELALVTSDNYDITSPVAAGVIVPTPAAVGPGLAILSFLMLRRQRKQLAQA